MVTFCINIWPLICFKVGEDLTEGEARVLEEYGWTPNTGLGSMLNYCDRVVHDRKSDADVSEWRSKIGKLLMIGYDGGTIVLPHLPKKFKGTKHIREPRDDVCALN
ncbi:Nac domain-containing protein [Thalictrum thalictroides]|uniref:Nac domain-containing protein n=1 Tax=Thalictrum thalictroides TaxID=46969 RepID=A0A7J6WHH9_THATH|nr:Nac domain-containing protein [Thalictrum thalictroides]